MSSHSQNATKAGTKTNAANKNRVVALSNDDSNDIDLRKSHRKGRKDDDPARRIEGNVSLLKRFEKDENRRRQSCK
jgi:hypothetical protein